MLVYVLMVLNTLVWGGTFIAGRVMDPGENPIVTAFVRFFLASVLLLVFCALTKESLRLPSRRHFFIQVFMAFVGIFLYTILFHWGMQTVPAGRASVIVTTSPIFITIMAAIFYKENLTPIKVIGVLLAVLGAVIVVSYGNVRAFFSGGFNQGELLLFGCALCWATFVILGKLMLNQLKPIVSLAWSFMLGTLMLLPAAVASGNLSAVFSYSFNTWMGVLYLAVFSTFVGYIWYYRVLQEVGPTRASLISCMVPPCAILQAIILLGEPAGWSLVVGGITTVAGVFIVNYIATRKPKAK